MRHWREQPIQSQHMSFFNRLEKLSYRISATKDFGMKLGTKPGLIIVLKGVMILYLLLFSADYITTDTDASFSDQLKTNGNVAFGVWENEKADEPSDKDTSNDNVEKTCQQTSSEEDTEEDISQDSNNKTSQEGEAC